MSHDDLGPFRRHYPLNADENWVLTDALCVINTETYEVVWYNPEADAIVKEAREYVRKRGDLVIKTLLERAAEPG